jgi:hypothetical protein
MATVDNISVLANAPTGSASPDSLTRAHGKIWTAYTDGAGSTGGGSSTVVEYAKDGSVLNTLTLPGYVDGLKYDPNTGMMWAMQNQDGNPQLTIINPETGRITGTYGYIDSSATQGYDDVVFDGNEVYLSKTNPPSQSGYATIVELENGNRPSGPLITTPVFYTGELGLDTVTGQMAVIPQNDPDSLKAAPNGDLLFSSGDDGVIIDIHNVGQKNQKVTFTPIQGVTAGSAGLDDVIQTNATSGTFYISDTADNRILSVHISNLNPNDYYASVGSLNAFGEVDPLTGAFTPLVSAANAPGMVFGAPHGVTFIADKTGASTASTPIAPPHAMIAAMAGLASARAATPTAIHAADHAGFAQLSAPSRVAIA